MAGNTIHNINIQVGAVYRIKNRTSQGGFRFYRCTEIAYGATDQEDVVGFTSLDKSNNGELRIPFAMLWAMDKLEKVSGNHF